MVRKLAIIGASVSVLLFAEDGSRQKIQVSKTEHIEFPSRGVLRLMNSIGELTVQGWDQPDMEITTIKSTKAEYDPQKGENSSRELQKVRVAAQRHGDEIVLTTDFPRHRALPPGSPWGGAAHFDLKYDIKVPRNAQTVIDHDVGEINVDDVSGDIRVSALQGTITLRLPENVQYDIDAKSDWGNVTSDFGGREKRRSWLIGHQIVEHNPGAAQKLRLRIGYGDIVILQIRKPAYPAPVPQ